MFIWHSILEQRSTFFISFVPFHKICLPKTLVKWGRKILAKFWVSITTFEAHPLSSASSTLELYSEHCITSKMECFTKY